ncbi:DNA topoisomerase, partial [Vibrio anguillarum]
NTFKAKEGAQEGHEAIRPSILEADISSISDPTQKAMYQMIFCRTIASQMSDAQYNKTDVILSAGFAMRGLDIQFIASGRMMTFDGWKAIYKDNDDDDEDDSLDNLAEQTIPQLIQNESVPVRQV